MSLLEADDDDEECGEGEDRAAERSLADPLVRTQSLT